MPGPDPPLPSWLRAWEWLRALGRVLWLVRFSVVFVAIGTVALLANGDVDRRARRRTPRRAASNGHRCRRSIGRRCGSPAASR